MLYPNRILGAVSLTLLLMTAACSLGPTETTAPRSYFLNPEISWKNPHGSGERIGASVLLITQPKAQAGFDTARMAYLLRPYEVNHYAFNQWADTPARLLHQVLVENLDKTGSWRAVLQTAWHGAGAVSPRLRQSDLGATVFLQPEPHPSCPARPAHRNQEAVDSRQPIF